jgi:hypothetical protein
MLLLLCCIMLFLSMLVNVLPLEFDELVVEDCWRLEAWFSGRLGDVDFYKL